MVWGPYRPEKDARNGHTRGFTQAGYKQIQQVYRRDRWYYVWRAFSQVMMILLIGIGAIAAYGFYRGWATWEFLTGYWMVATIKNISDFMMERWKK